MASVILDLGELLSKYSRHQVDWYNIGLQLGIKKHVLDRIKQDCPNKTVDCFREMLGYWLCYDESATESHLQKAIEEAEGLIPPSRNKWINTQSGHYLIAITLPIILGVIMVVYYQHSNSPIKNTAEILKTEYRAQKVMKFNLPISGNSDLEYLGIVMKDRYGHEFGHSELAQNYSGEGGRLIVTGLPGSGKITLLRHLAKGWANGRVLKSCQILFLISLGSLEGEVNTLGDLLSKSGFGDLVNLKDISEKIYAINGAGTCFLFDAYDELKGKYEFINAIIEGSKIHSSFCLLTSRPFSNEKFEKEIQIEILGYNIDNLMNYLHKLSDNAILVNAIKRSWDDSPEVKEMCTLPLNMAMMLYIYSYESSVSLKTTAQLYIAFMNVTIKHYEGRRLEWNTESLWQCIRANAPDGDDLCSAFNILHQVAYDTVFKRQTSFPDIKAIKDHINQLSFVGVTSVPGSESRIKFTFSHPTFLEFFAALHLTTLPLNEQLAFITTRFHDRAISWSSLRFRKYWLSLPVSHEMIVEFYLSLVGDKFHYNTSGTTPFLKQLFLKSNIDIGVCIIYKWVEEGLGWTTQQFRNTIDSVFNTNYSVCVYHSFLDAFERAPISEFQSDLLLSPQDDNKLELKIIEKKGLFDYFIMATLNFVDYVYLTREDQLHLFLCIQGLRDNKDSNCHGLKFPSITSLTITYYPHNADILYKMKRVLPNLEYIDIRLRFHNPWKQINSAVMESLLKTLKQLEIALVLLNLKIEIHLDISIDRCCVENTKIALCIDEINYISLHHITLMDVCHNNNFTQHLCKSVLEYSTYIEDAAHAQSLVTCIQQAQSLKTLSLVYYEGAMDKIKQKEIFRNLPQTLQTLNVRGSKLYTFGAICNVSSTLDVKLIVDALIERKNLRKLTISISNVEDLKILTQLTFLIHLHIILDDSFAVDKSTILLIVNHLQHFPHLESFALTGNDRRCRLSDHYKQNVLSTIFNISPARDIQICLCLFDECNHLPQFDEIFSGISYGCYLQEEYIDESAIMLLNLCEREAYTIAVTIR